MMNVEFQNQAGIVIGAALGIGLAIVLILSMRGVKLALFDQDKKGIGESKVGIV